MENKIKNMFEYQRFSGNSKLASLIADTEARFDAALSDDDLEFVSAAGMPEMNEDEDKDTL